MMRRMIALLLATLIFLTSCTKQANQMEKTDTKTSAITETSLVGSSTEQIIQQTGSNVDDAVPTAPPYSPAFGTERNDEQNILVFPEDIQPDFAALSTPSLLQYVEDNIYCDLVEQFDSEDYIVESISAVYVSKEYLEEVAYNSKSNIYFGHTLEELDAQFQGTRYIFSLGENGETVVEQFARYDDTYERVIQNITIGTGVILVCVTVSVVSGGVGAPAAVSMIFASAAKTGTAYALSSGTISAVVAGTVTGIQTGDFEEVKKASALAGSESFKWGAITGVITGGITKAVEIYHSAHTIPSPRESEITVLDRTKNSTEQVSFLDGQEVPMNTPGATRPDVVVRNADGTVKAIEVKNYNLAQSSNRNTLLNELERQVTDRARNLPVGSTQEIVLDVRGRGFSDDLINTMVAAIRNRLADIYPDIPITILRY